MTQSTRQPAPPAAFGLDVPQWAGIVFVSVLVAVAAVHRQASATWWPGLGLFATAAIFGHLVLVASRSIALPGLVAFGGAVQWIIAPWLSTFYPPTFPMYTLAVPVDTLLTYTVPATVFLWVGLHWPLRNAFVATSATYSTRPIPAGMRKPLDALFVAAMVTASFSSQWVPWKLSFLFYILASLRFFVALCWLLTRTPGWVLRVLAVIAQLMALATDQGLFYMIFQWGGYFLLALALQRAWRLTVAVALAGALLAGAVVGNFKQDYRELLQAGQLSSTAQQFAALGSMTWDTITGRGFHQPFGDLLVRFNQGWIVARVMSQVPETIPHAHGATLVDAAAFAIVPRALFPEKREGSSRSLFAAYTGLPLTSSTAMGLSVIGELYANFGAVGGLFGTLAYGLVIGTIFAWFVRRSQKSVVWLALAPVVLLPVLEPGYNIEDVANHIVKSGLVIAVLVRIAPAVRSLLPGGPMPAISGDHLRRRFPDTRQP